MKGNFEGAIYAILVSFILGVMLCPFIIPVLTKLKFGQTEREDGPESHLRKGGTPTMGGIAILISLFITSLVFIFTAEEKTDAVAVLMFTMGFGIIGFVDDYIKINKKRSMGLRAYQKIIGQAIITAVFAFYIYKAGIGTEVLIPFTKGKMVDLGVLYIPFLFVVVLGTVNGVNLTDGLDGLASGVTMIVAAFFMLTAWAAGSPVMYIAASAIGSLLSFLIFNSYPARVFMGDTGSLALGGFVAASALILKMPLFILIVGFIYLIETVSVIIQVAYYRKTKKRFFKMAPIHHHFELSGWSETKVVALFYIVTAFVCLIGFLGCKYMF